MKYTVIGLYKRSRNDCEGITHDCSTYNEAIQLKKKWQESNQYRKIMIAKPE